MIYTLDTEFHDVGPSKPIELISLGIKAEDGRHWYGVNREFNWLKLGPDEWLVKNVFPKLNANPNTEKTRRQMRAELLEFFEKDFHPIFWGYFADWDWILFCHLFGPMIGGPPPTFPQLCLDVEQYRLMLGLSMNSFPRVDERREHNALYDAEWTMDALITLRAHHQAQLARIGVGCV